MSFTGDQLRTLYLEYFVEKTHKLLPSASLIPHGDPTLLLTTAGMVQFKPYFMGEAAPPAPRLTTCQKCFRTTDIDSVGRRLAPDLLRDAGQLLHRRLLQEGSHRLRLGVRHRASEDSGRTACGPPFTCDDDEAFAILAGRRACRISASSAWARRTTSGVRPATPAPAARAARSTTTSARTSAAAQPDCGPACKCGRFCEIWNLVFMQYNQDKAGARTPLPRPTIDTGMGLERMTTIMQGKSSVYQTDIFDYLLDKVAKVSGKNTARRRDRPRHAHRRRALAAASPSSSPTALFPPTRAEATSCAGCCAAPPCSAATWVWTSRSWCP